MTDLTSTDQQVANQRRNRDEAIKRDISKLKAALSSMTTSSDLAISICKQLPIDLGGLGYDVFQAELCKERANEIAMLLQKGFEPIEDAYRLAIDLESAFRGGEPRTDVEAATAVPFGAGGVQMSLAGQQPMTAERATKTVDALLELAGSGPGGNVVDRFFETCK